MPVPGIEAVPIRPRWLRLTVNGAPPTLQLNPLFERFSRTPGISLKERRNRHPMIDLCVCACGATMDNTLGEGGSRVRGSHVLGTKVISPVAKSIEGTVVCAENSLQDVYVVQATNDMFEFHECLLSATLRAESVARCRSYFFCSIRY